MTIPIGTAAAAGLDRNEPGPSWSRPDDDATDGSLTLRDGAPEKIARRACADW